MQTRFTSRKSSALLCLSFAIVVLGSSLTWAADDGLPAATELYEVDEDFHFQGEYFGSIQIHFTDGVFRQFNMGFQVIAIGQQNFDAVLYPGGLPGHGWSTGPKYKMRATRIGDRVDFTGSGYRVVINGEDALVHAANGQPLGQLAKIERASSTMNMVAPWGATPLFTGWDANAFKNGKTTDGGFENYLEMGTELKEVYKDYTMHVEFRLPYMPTASEQGRGNSGVYLQSRYEVQILDSFGRDRRKNYCGGLYKQRAPDVNMCYPPLAWQTYDIIFRSPRFDAVGTKIRNARISVFHNGVAIHDDVDVTAKTGGGQQEGPKLLPTKLQDHRNPVRFRNIWVLDHHKYANPPFAPYVGL